MSNTKYAVGDVVGLIGDDRPGRWEIKEIKGSKVLAMPLEGQQDGTKYRGVRTEMYRIIDAPPPAEDGPHGKVFSVPFRPRNYAGQIVTSPIPEIRGRKIAGRPFVVMADKGKHVNVSPLGDDTDEYFRIPGELLNVIDRAELTRMLLDEQYEYAVGGDEQSAIRTVQSMISRQHAEGES